MSLKSERENLAALLTAAVGFPVTPYVPDRINPPCGMVLPGSPYLERGNTFGSFLARWEVVLVSLAKVNAVGTSELDDHTENAIVTLVNAGYGVETVSDPYALNTQNANYLADTITVTSTVNL